MFLFILAILFLLIAIGAYIGNRATHPERYTGLQADGRRSGKLVLRIVSGAFAFFFAITLFFSSFTTVGTKEEGVVTAFGRPTGHLSNGAHFIAPWEKVTEMDAAVQPENFTGGPDSKGGDRCVDVRIGNQSVACVETRMQWRIQPQDADELFKDYRSFDHLRSSLVLPQLRSALNNAFQDYNPLSLLVTGQPVKDVLNQMGAEVTQVMQSEVGTRIKIVNVIIPLVNYDSATQANINQFQVQVAQTKIATQKVETAKQQALANDILSKSLQQSGVNVLIDKCLNLVDQGKNVPGWCFPPGSNVLLQTPTNAK